MELTSDLVAIQGILTSVIKNTGEFTRINYTGGNEEKVLTIMIEIQKFLSSKNYFNDEKINPIFDKQLEDIVFFLAINTAYSKPLELDEYSHLKDIMPQLSKYLLVNIVYGLDLCKYYCKTIEKLPIDFTAELLAEMIPCLKKSVPEIHLKYAHMFLEAAVNKLASTDGSKKKEDCIADISKVANIILQNLTGIYYDSNQTKVLKAIHICQHMGYSLLSFFNLLLYCNEECLALEKLISNILGASCTVMRNVTLNVFCAWAETEEDDQPLQSLISGKAYLVVEKYAKYSDASELIGMLSTIAKKPRTLAEIIRDSDVSTIINRVNRKDSDQKSWFQALIKTQILNNKDAMECASTWAHLCCEEDVTRLLNLIVQTNDVEAQKLVVKCASALSVDKLILISTRYFYKNKFDYVLNEDVRPQLMLVFNKLKESPDLNEDLVKEMHLLLLQNPKLVFSCIYNECVKNKFYTACLKDALSSIGEIAQIGNIGVETLKEVILNNKPNSQNVNNYVELFKTLKEISCSFNEVVLMQVLLPLLTQLHTDKAFEDLNYSLQVFLEGDIRISVQERNMNVINLLLNIMKDCRCKFLEFDNVKQQNAKYVVNIIIGLCDIIHSNIEADLHSEGDDVFTTYYKKYLTSTTDSSLFEQLFPEFDINNHADCVSQMIKILPLSVTSEWLRISEEVVKLCGIEKTTELFTDVMILLCHVVETQSENTETTARLFSALKYCIQHFGMVIQQNLQINPTIDVEVHVAKYICGLLRNLPEALKDEEGVSLINILSDRSLKVLSEDRNFVCLLISINNTHICQNLARFK